MISIVWKVECKNFWWYFYFIIYLELVFVTTSQMEEFKVTIKTSCNYFLLLIIVANPHTWFLKWIKVIQASDSCVINLCKCQCITLSDNDSIIKKTKIFYWVFNFKWCDLLWRITEIPQLNVFIGWSTN